MTFRTVLSAIALSACLLTGSAFGQAKTLAEIQAAVAASSSELEQVDAMLGVADPNQRLAALQLLITSGHPTYMKRAKEVGLLSADPEMQRVAIAATFDQGGPFRLEIDLTSANEVTFAAVARWLRQYNGNLNNTSKLGEYTFQTTPYDQKNGCWMFASEKSCAIVGTGAAYSLNSWSNGGGSLRLQPDGTLLGSFTSRYDSDASSVPARIPLVE